MPADWELPPGVSRNLWDYFHDPASARDYDRQIADSPLLRHDIAFVRRHCPSQGRLIDLGCGTGRLALALAPLGYQVLAVDLSPEMLRVLEEKARAAGVQVQTLSANLVELDALPDASFDHAACLFSTLGLIAGSDERIRFLRHVHRLLKPGGRFVLHVHNRWFNVWTHGGRRLLTRDLWNSFLGRSAAGDYVMPGQHGIGSLTMHLFTRREIVRLLKSIGFAILEVRPLSLRDDGRLCCPWWLGRLRSYGYLLAAAKPLAV